MPCVAKKASSAPPVSGVKDDSVKHDELLFNANGLWFEAHTKAAQVATSLEALLPELQYAADQAQTAVDLYYSVREELCDLPTRNPVQEERLSRLNNLLDSTRIDGDEINSLKRQIKNIRTYVRYMSECRLP
jgi:hypothetical protein